MSFCLFINLIKCLKGLKFQNSWTHSLTKVRYRAARAAKNMQLRFKKKCDNIYILANKPFAIKARDNV